MAAPNSYIKAEVGWLSPNGKYYPCEVGSLRHLTMMHFEKAVELVKHFYPDADVGEHMYEINREDAQTFLVHSGWIRFDTSDLWFKQRPTQKQIDATFDLYQQFLRFESGRGEWLPIDITRKFLAWSGLHFLSRKGDDYSQFSAYDDD